MRNDPRSFSTRDSMNYRQYWNAGPLADRWLAVHYPSRLVVDFSNHSFHAEDSSVSCRNPPNGCLVSFARRPCWHRVGDFGSFGG
jgi:hypothetical protein